MPPLSTVDAQLLASFYEGITNPQRFAQGLRRIGELLDCQRVSVNLWDRRGNWGCGSEAMHHDGGWQLKASDDILPEPALRAIVSQFAPGSWKLVEQLHSSSCVANAVLRADGHASLCTRITLSHAEALVSLNTHGGDWRLEQIEQAHKACRALLPALEAIARQQQLAQQVRSLSTMLDSLRMPMMLIDSAQRALAANASARGLFNLSGKTSSGKIETALPGASASQFAQLIRQACSKTAAGGVLPLQLNEAADVAHLLVLPLHLKRNSGRQTVALVLLHGPTSTSGHAKHLLQHVYGLTPAEARLALLILDGLSPSHAASVLKLSVTTVRTQLSSVLKKTGAQRQPDLVRRLVPLMLLDQGITNR